MKKLLFALVAILLAGSAYASSGYLSGGDAYIQTYKPSFQCFTTASYDGDQTDYDAADALCNADCSGSHVCRVDEVLTMYSQDAGTLPVTGEGWVNGGPPGYTADANDCLGWSSNALGDYGRYWDFANKQGWMRGCVNTLKFACCK